MKQRFFLILLATTIWFASCSNKSNIDYPKTKKIDQVDEYFGVTVEDPYRWLEDDRSAETEEWVVAQNKVTSDFLAQIPYRENIRKRLENLWNYEKIGHVMKKGGRYYFYKNDGLQDQDVLYIQHSVDAEPKILIDPNELSEDGTIAMSRDFAISKDGKYIAYQISKGGSDWHEIHIKDIETGEDLDEYIEWVKFSNIAWYKNGIFYSRYPETKEGEELSGVNKSHKVCYHKLGTDVKEDLVIFENNENPMLNYSADVSSDEKYLFIYETESTNGNNLYVKNLRKNNNFVKLTTGFKYDYTVVDQVGDNLMVLTNYRSPKYKLVRININTLDVGNWVDVLPERKDVLRECILAGDKIIASYMKDAHNKLEVYNLKGEYLYDIELPVLGSVRDLSGSVTSKEVFYTFTTFTVPPTVYSYNVAKNEVEVYFEPEVDFDAALYETKQIFYEAKDGIKVPMFIVHKKGLKLDGKNPTLLYAYGGFNISLLPRFNASRLVWLENDGVFAMPNIRGGGEYGENWHKSGMKLNKQNVFDDFIGASEFLIEQKYTSSDKLTIQGGSNGGLLIGAVINQRPDLYKVAFPEVGVMDMLRFHRFTIGWAWVNEYGSSDDSIQFGNLYNYSPLHNIRSGIEYPSVMVITADHDDRVVPAHSFKYIATLQEKYNGSNPTLIRIQTKAGHGGGKPTRIRIEEDADKWAFAFYNMKEEVSY